MNGFIKPRFEKGSKEKIVSFRIGASRGKDPVNGKYRYEFRTIKTDSWREARRALVELQNEIAKGTFIKPGKTTVGDFLQAWLNDYCKASLSFRTVELYSYLCRVHITPAVGKIALTDINPQQLQHFYSEKLTSALSPRTVQLLHVVLHKALKKAVIMNLIQRNPADFVDKPRTERPQIHPMNVEDINRFLDAAKQGEYYSLFFCYLFTGMRRSELLALRWKDVDLLGMTISVTQSMEYRNKVKDHVRFKETKTKGSAGSIALSPANVIVLRQQLEDQQGIRKSLGLPALKEDDLVFSHFDGSPLLPDTISHAWRKLIAKCGLKGVRLHDARHTMATVMFKQGVHPKIVQERLRHSRIATTLDTYTHVVPGLQQAAANAMDNILNKETKLDEELKQLIQT